jgi:hypothetical protein
LASRYYGSKNSAVADMQQYLNQRGASLKVDGIWGEQTERAYQKYMGGASASGGTLLSTVADSDQEIEKRAAQKYGQVYQDKKQDLSYQAGQKKAEYEASIGDLEPLYESKLKDLGQELAVQKQQQDNQTLARGMGRSSYASDLGRSTERAYEDEKNALLLQKAGKVAQISRKIQALDATLQHKSNLLEREQQRSVADEVEKLKKQRDKELIAAIKYNNSLTQKAGSALLRSIKG